MEHRINRGIRAPEVLVIDEDGRNLGRMRTFAAIAMAEERDLDLVEVSTSGPCPVCKILKYGKFKFEQSKRDNELKKKNREATKAVKIVQLSPKADEHDFLTQIGKAEKFLQAGHKIKVVVKKRRDTDKSRITESDNRVIRNAIARLEKYGKVDGKIAYQPREPFFFIAPIAEKKTQE